MLKRLRDSHIKTRYLCFCSQVRYFFPI